VVELSIDQKQVQGWHGKDSIKVDTGRTPRKRSGMPMVWIEIPAVII
jgi:hypothetical protein